jgi:tripartite-type tricarboxylate transporter receptor subunit TctC
MIRIVVRVGPTGTFDEFCRILERHYSKYIPGNPNVIMQYMRGGTNAANYMDDAKNDFVNLRSGMTSELQGRPK